MHDNIKKGNEEYLKSNNYKDAFKAYKEALLTFPDSFSTNVRVRQSFGV